MSSLFQVLEKAIIAFADFAWGTPLLVLLLGGGLFFLVYSRLLPFRYFGHAIQILRGKYDDPNEAGDLNHYEALSTALAATVGMGNISGVAVAIAMGGPGAIFWMWVSAFIGIATKFFTCTLAIMYRGKDSAGEIQGGPMYVIREGLGPKWHGLAVFFCVAGLFGALPMFQANQLTQAVRDLLLKPNGITTGLQTDFITGLVLVGIVSSVIFGGIKRIGTVAGKLVPAMVSLYIVAVLYILAVNISALPASIQLIFTDAFTGNAVLGGALGALIITGVRRAAFSNEAGIGTAPMAHGAAKTDQPVREGLVAMLGPAIDTLIVCTMTALAIIVTGVYTDAGASGITLTALAFESAMSTPGIVILGIAVSIFALTTMFSMSYYGAKCLSFLVGAQYQQLYNVFYVASILVGAVASLQAALSLIDGMYAMMAFPTMISAIVLAPKVLEAAKTYFKGMKVKEI